MEILILCGAAFFAGLVDAVVGGGGLIQVPALFATFPQAAPATLFGTNKLASIFGTSVATWRYSRRVDIPWRIALPATLFALGFSYLGAKAVAMFPPAVLRPVILVLMVAVALYTFTRKDFGQVQQQTSRGWMDIGIAALIGSGLGFYDGFFGPGTGSFLIFLFIKSFGLDFLHASVAAKVVNVATNLAALGFFLGHGNAFYTAALAMALFNMAGALLGSHLAMRHGSRFVRKLFLVVVALLITKFARDTFFL